MDHDLKRTRRTLEKQVESANRLTVADAEEAKDLFGNVTSMAKTLRGTAKSRLAELEELQVQTETLEKEVKQKEIVLQALLDRLESQPMPDRSDTLAYMQAVNERMAARGKLLSLAPANLELIGDRMHLSTSALCMEVFTLVDSGFVSLLNKKEYELHREEWIRRLYEFGPHVVAIGVDVVVANPAPSIALALLGLTRDTQAEALRIEKEQVE
jgi:hypothetical protein